MYEYLFIGVSVLLLACYGNYIGRKWLQVGASSQAALPAATEPVSADPEPVKEATLLLERAGVLSDSFYWVIFDGESYQTYRGLGPPGLLGAYTWRSWDGTCDYCCARMIQIRQIITRDVPAGARDLYLMRQRPIRVYCLDCGKPQDHLRYSTYFTPPKQLPEPFCSHVGLYPALMALACDNGRLTKQIRLDMLLAESERLRQRSAEVARAVGVLTREMHPSIEGEAYRDDGLIEATTPRGLPEKT